MSAITEKSPSVVTMSDHTPEINANVLTITRPAATHQQPSHSTDVLSNMEDCDSARSSISPPQTAHREKSAGEIENSPYSFLQKSESKQNINTSVFDADIEALSQQKTEAGSSKTGLVNIRSKCVSSANAWPSRMEQKRMMKARKRDRACCVCWAGMTKRNRNLVKVAILLVLIGLIIGLCVGVTRAVHGGVWQPN